jgi:hypothetical protein
MSRTFKAHTPLEALVLEQALLSARQLQQTADEAPDAHVLARVKRQAGGETGGRRAVPTSPLARRSPRGFRWACGW